MSQTRKFSMQDHVQFVQIGEQKRRCAILKKWENGMTVIDLTPLDAIDVGRIKGILQQPMADRFELWELLSLFTLSNGVNALTYFNQFAKPIGETGMLTNISQDLFDSVAPTVDNKMVGSDSSNPSEAQLTGGNGAAPSFTYTGQ